MQSIDEIPIPLPSSIVEYICAIYVKINNYAASEHYLQNRMIWYKCLTSCETYLNERKVSFAISVVEIARTLLKHYYFDVDNCYSFPGLARNTPELREKAERFQAGEISREDYDFADSMKISQLSNVAFYVQSVGKVFILAVIVGILFAVKVNDSTENNNWGLAVLIACATETFRYAFDLLDFSSPNDWDSFKFDLLGLNRISNFQLSRRGSKAPVQMADFGHPTGSLRIKNFSFQLHERDSKNAESSFQNFK